MLVDGDHRVIAGIVAAPDNESLLRESAAFRYGVICSTESGFEPGDLILDGVLVDKGR